DQLAVMADERVGAADEHARLLGDLAAGLGGMRAIVDARAGNQLGVWNDRQELDRRELVIGRGALGGGLDLRQETRTQRLAQALAVDAPVHRDHAVAAHHSEQAFAVRHIAEKFHSSCPLSLRRHARRCAGHPRPSFYRKTWMAGTSPAMAMVDTRFACPA